MQRSPEGRRGEVTLARPHCDCRDGEGGVSERHAEKKRAEANAVVECIHGEDELTS